MSQDRWMCLETVHMAWHVAIFWPVAVHVDDENLYK